MSVLTVAGQKGGSGKSTLVRNLAIHFALDDYKVGIVDADLIQQHSSEFFADRIKEAGREVWIGRDDIPGLTVRVWDRSSPEVPGFNRHSPTSRSGFPSVRLSRRWPRSPTW